MNSGNNSNRLSVIFLFMISLIISNNLDGQTWLRTMDRLPDTGQKINYTNSPGEDSDYEINTPYYVDNGDGTVTDTITGLMWQKQDGGEMSYDSAVDWVGRLALAGYQDWRLPGIHESFSLMNLDALNPALNKFAFTDTGAEYWWSADVAVNNPSKVWVTNSGGGQGAHPKTETISAGGTKKFHARAVRNTHPPNTLQARFKFIADSVVLDLLTGLMWERYPLNDSINWENALMRAENIVLGGYCDWRLPNIKEIESIQDEKNISPAVNKNFFSAIRSAKYWSSTSQFNRGVNAWYIDYQNLGLTTYGAKNTRACYAICVRTAEDQLLGVQNNTMTHSGTMIYPNPAGQALHLRGFSAGLYDIVLLNAVGEVLQRSSVQITEENADYLFCVDHIAPGYYLMQVMMSGHLVKTQIIVVTGQ